MISKYVKLLFALLGIGILVLLYFEYDPINSILFPKCPLYATTGIYCPGCGSQRATHALLHLDFMGVARSNMLFIPAFFAVTQHAFARFMNIFFGKNYKSILDHPKAAWVVLFFVILFFILRNIPYEPFIYLAPH